MKPRSIPLINVSRLAAIAITFQQATAGTTWDGTGTPNTNINTATNWDVDTLPDLTGSASVTFGSANATATVNTDVEFTKATFSASFNIASGAGNFVLRGSTSGSTAVLQSNSGASNVQINEQLLIESLSPTSGSQGTLLTINNNRNVADTTALRINNGISLAAGSTAAYYDIRYANGSGGLGDTRIAGTISGLGTLANAGTAWTGDLLIAGNQSLSTSNISISSGSGFGNPTAAARLVLGETSGDSQTWNNITLNNIMNAAIGGTITANAISGNSAAKITGTGASGATLKLSSGTLNATNIVVGGAGTGENTLSVVKQNAGTLAVSGAHTYTGSTTVDGGTLTLNSGVTLGTSGIAVNGGTLSQLSTTLANSIVINAGGTLSGEGSTAGSLTFGAGNTNLTFDSSTATGAFTADSIVSSGASVLLTPSGATTIGTTYTILKQTTGSFSGSPAANFIAASRGTLAFANSNKDLTLTPTAAASLAWRGNAANPSHWDVASTLNWDNSGSDRFYANDTVTFDDSASSFTVAAQTSISPGSIVINNSTNAYAISGSGIVSSGTLTKSGSNTAVIGNTVTSIGVVVNTGTLTLSATNTIGASGVEVNGGVLNLNAANTFTNGITLNGGTLNATVGTNATTGSLGSFATARTIALNGGALSYGGANLSSDNINLSVTGNSSIGVSAAASTLRAGGTFSGSGDLTITGTGVVALGKNSSSPTWGSGYSGDIIVSNGAVLSLRNEQSLGDTTGGTTIQSGGTLMLDPFSQSALTLASESIAFQGNSTLSTRLNGQSSLAVALSGNISTAGVTNVNSLGASTTTTLGGVISGNGGLTFGSASTVSGLTAAAGNYVLSNTNSYFGNTNVNNGKLVVNGNISTSSLTTVADGATLGGSGTIGALTVSSGGTLAPGNSPGTLTVGGTLSLENLSILSFELNPTNTTVGGSINDLITGVTNLTLDGLLNVTASTSSFTGVTSGVWRLFNYTGSLTDNALTLNTMPALDLGYSWSLDTATANQVNLTIVPEPNAAALVGGLGVLALLRRRRA